MMRRRSGNQVTQVVPKEALHVVFAGEAPCPLPASGLLGEYRRVMGAQEGGGRKAELHVQMNPHIDGYGLGREAHSGSGAGILIGALAYPLLPHFKGISSSCIIVSIQKALGSSIRSTFGVVFFE